MLCDIGASELLFPEPWFSAHAAAAEKAEDFASLASTYHASRAATLRRYVERANIPVAVVFFSWKLKPTQQGIIGNADQGNLFGISAEQELQDAKQLRIDYAIYSESLKSLGYYFPADKSVDRREPIIDEATLGDCADAVSSFLDVGPCAGDFSINAIPLPTALNECGPENRCNIALILRPRVPKPRSRKSSRKSSPGTPTLFD
jgi:hypothetical protein